MSAYSLPEVIKLRNRLEALEAMLLALCKQMDEVIRKQEQANSGQVGRRTDRKRY